MYKVIRPLLFLLNPEQAHNLFAKTGIFLSRSWLKKIIEFIYSFEDDRLAIEAFGVIFKNPVGLAAGFDKNGKLSEFLPSLGFGFTEIGSVSAKPSSGNPKPRLFRLPLDEALINRMGLNNEGADAIAQRVQTQNLNIPLGINIVKTHDPNIIEYRAIQDFSYSFERLYPLASFITINISCPNTAEGKTFEEPEALDKLLSALNAIEEKFTLKKPLLVKISPDISFSLLDAVLSVSQKHHVSGYVVSNTSLSRSNLQTPESDIAAIGKGGLSGKPIQKNTLDRISYIYKKLNKPFIIGCGGVFSAQDAYNQIKAGASLVELYTGLIYEGPGLIKKIKRGLVKLLEQDGLSSIKQAVGKNT